MDSANPMPIGATTFTRKPGLVAMLGTCSQPAARALAVNTDAESVWHNVSVTGNGNTELRRALFDKIIAQEIAHQIPSARRTAASGGSIPGRAEADSTRDAELESVELRRSSPGWGEPSCTVLRRTMAPNPALENKTGTVKWGSNLLASKAQDCFGPYHTVPYCNFVTEHCRPTFNFRLMGTPNWLVSICRRALFQFKSSCFAPPLRTGSTVCCRRRPALELTPANKATSSRLGVATSYGSSLIRSRGSMLGTEYTGRYFYNEQQEEVKRERVSGCHGHRSVAVSHPITSSCARLCPVIAIVTVGLLFFANGFVGTAGGVAQGSTERVIDTVRSTETYAPIAQPLPHSGAAALPLKALSTVRFTETYAPVAQPQSGAAAMPLQALSTLGLKPTLASSRSVDMYSIADLISLAASGRSLQITQSTAARMEGNTFHLHYHILYDLRTLLGSAEATYLEIGSFCGGSLSLMFQHPFKTQFISVDPLHARGDLESAFLANVATFNKRHGEPQRHKHFKLFSTDATLPARLRANGVRIDLLFIDGDHSTSGVKADWNAFSPFMNPGGFIVFDDYLDAEYSPEVRGAVDEIVARLPADGYEVWGVIPNTARAPPLAFDHSNDFIIRKRAT
jgi:predicted O-methyltransferase YrrM